MWVNHATADFTKGEVQIMCTMPDCSKQNLVHIAKLPEIEVELSL
jgi:hypothetical protein